MSAIQMAPNASGTGTLSIASPNTNSNRTLTLPDQTGTLVSTSGVNAVGQIPFSTDGSTYTATAKIVSGTTVATTSGTSIDFTSIPSWVKRITVMYNAVGTNGANLYLIQIGSGSISNTGYTSDAMYPNGPTNSGNVTSGFVQQGLAFAYATDLGYNGSTTLTTLGSNIWVASGTLVAGTGRAHFSAGSKTLSGTLDRLRITTGGSVDTFNNGSINLLWE